MICAWMFDPRVNTVLASHLTNSRAKDQTFWMMSGNTGASPHQFSRQLGDGPAGVLGLVSLTFCSACVQSRARTTCGHWWRLEQQIGFNLCCQIRCSSLGPNMLRVFLRFYRNLYNFRAPHGSRKLVGVQAGQISIVTILTSLFFNSIFIRL